MQNSKYIYGKSYTLRFSILTFEFILGFGFLVRCVFTTESAILIQVQLVRSISFVLGRRIVFPLAFAASQQYDLTHDSSLTLLISVTDGAVCSAASTVSFFTRSLQ
jgi:hypothetical protein